MKMSFYRFHFCSWIIFPTYAHTTYTVELPGDLSQPQTGILSYDNDNGDLNNEPDTDIDTEKESREVLNKLWILPVLLRRRSWKTFYDFREEAMKFSSI